MPSSTNVQAPHTCLGDNALDRPIAVTSFPTQQAYRKIERMISIRSLAAEIEAAYADAKSGLPWFKLARFGDVRTDRNCLRHNANVLAVSGIEADYDAGEMPPAEAERRLRQAGIAGLVYTTASHTDAAPRWRVFCPLSTEYRPDERTAFMARLNGLMDGVLAGESFTLSQSYYGGNVRGRPPIDIRLIDGRPIDEASELDSVALPKGQRRAVDGATRTTDLSGSGELMRLADTIKYHEEGTIDDLIAALAENPRAKAHVEKEEKVAAGRGERAIKRAWDRAREPMTDDVFDNLDGPVPDAEALELIGDLPAPVANDNGSTPCPTAQPNAKPSRDPGGDYALSNAFADRVRGRMRFNHADRKWMHYEAAAGAWRTCERGEAEAEMQACAKARFDDACNAYRRNPSDANLRLQNEAASYLKNHNLLTRALGMAKARRDLVCLPTDFNANLYAFPVANGLIDLRTGKLTPPAADLMIWKRSPVQFDSTACCPMFDSFIARILPDAEVREFLQRAVGYTLTGLVDEEKVFLAYGVGRNGKSVFANILDALMGEFSMTVSPELFTKSSRDGEAAQQIVSLVGKRLALANEAAQGSVWRDDRLKMLASREPIQARYLYGQSFAFMPTAKVWFRTNHLPGAHDASDGFWRRLVAIPFTVQIPEDEIIGDLDRQIIRKELPGVLNWALAGARAYLSDGRLSVPKSLSRITAQYREACDILGQWLADHTIRDGQARLSSGEAYRAFCDFCREEGVKASAQVAFSRSMGERGFAPQRTSAGRYFAGLRLRTGLDDEEDLIG